MMTAVNSRNSRLLPFTLYKYHAMSFWNWKSSYFGRLIEPAAYLLFLLAGIGNQINIPDYPLYAFSGLICMITFRAATSAMSDVSNDRKWGVYATYRLHGGTTQGYILSIILFSLTLFIVQILLFIGILFALYDTNHLSYTKLVHMCLLAGVFLASWTCIGISVGSRVQSYSKRDLIVTVTSLPLIFTAPLFYQIQQAPEYLKFLSRVNPLTYQVNLVRDYSFRNLAFSLLALIFITSSSIILLEKSEILSVER